MNGIIYGYARVSTYTQAVEGNSLDAQKDALKAAGAERIYCDAFTGRSMERPEWNKLRKRLEPGDTLIVTKLDRLGRSVGQTATLIDKLLDYGVTINVLNLGILSADKDNPSNTLIRNILLAFAEYERDMIVQRTQEGKAIARQKPGYREGRPPKYSKEQLDHAMELLENHSYKQTAAMTGISESTLTRERRKRKITKNLE